MNDPLNGLRTEPYWTARTPFPEDLAGQALPASVDVAIIGAGYTGLNAAIQLAGAGLRVAALEQHTLGWGASSRNGGMLIPGLQLSMQSIAARYGLESAREFWGWSQRAIDFVEDTVRAARIDCDFSRTGHVHLAFKPRHAAHIQHEISDLRENYGYAVPRFIPAAGLHEEIGSRAYFGGMLDENAAAVDPAKYVFGLGRAAADAGAVIVADTRVTGIARSGQAFQVRTSKGALSADKVLLATNGYTGGLYRPADRGFFPVGSYIIVTEPLGPELQAELSPQGRMFYDSKNFLNYFRLTPDGRMLFGGRNTFSTKIDLVQSARFLQKRMVEVFPQLNHTPITHSWCGQLGVPFDLMPHMIADEGLYVAYGYAGHGVAVASYLGREVGEMIAGTRPDSLFSRIPHPRYFFAPLHALYLPFVAQWYRLADRYF
jgi:glycine/D-amino acid oxidase-like deaminating enzyme